ncbi:MAG: hypothetical protein K0Q92_3629, partial [Steroidobacteraceae bacterium]|nr:hypothetical protein [Steroidobacteraceae bacterium]
HRGVDDFKAGQGKFTAGVILGPAAEAAVAILRECRGPGSEHEN